MKDAFAAAHAHPTRSFVLILQLVLMLASIGPLRAATDPFPKDNQGWSTFTPGSDTRIVYVSSSGGSDAHGQVYAAADAAVGSDPFLPAGQVQAFKTIAAATAETRDGYPDWVLLKRGDTWYESAQIKEGRSAQEPFLLASYGQSSGRPLLKVGAEHGLKRCCNNSRNMAMVGISLYAHTRNPDSPEFTGHAGETGFWIYTNEGTVAENILIEDCKFRFFTNNVVQGKGTLRNIVVRRSVIVDNYSTEGHSQGFYSKGAAIVCEENVFDHNGWYKQGKNNEKAGGGATIFNHNTYFTKVKSAVFRGNMFLRPSSIGTKWRSDATGESENITIENNLYVDCEVAISLGGNNYEPAYRFKNIRVADNVLLDMGKSHQTTRVLGWYLKAYDWDQGEIHNNLFLHQRSNDVSNVYAISLAGECRDISIEGNIVHGLRTNGHLVKLGDSQQDRITFHNNTIMSPIYGEQLLSTLGSIDGITFSRNNWYSSRAGSSWYELDKREASWSQWQAASGETGGSNGQVALADTTRCIETYQQSLGKPATLPAFAAEARQQSKATWRVEYTAAAVNDWIRAGFSHGTTPVRAKLRTHRPAASGATMRTGMPDAIFSLDGRRIEGSSIVPGACGVYLRRVDGRLQKHSNHVK
jgi:hypothetical protein